MNSDKDKREEDAKTKVMSVNKREIKAGFLMQVRQKRNSCCFLRYFDAMLKTAFSALASNKCSFLKANLTGIKQK